MRRTQKLVYCAFNVVTGKSYIGWCTDFRERKNRHIRAAELGVKTRFYNAIRKHGASSFEWFVLFDDLKSFDDCKVMERRMIAMFDTYNNGYNSTLGGDGGFTGINTGIFKKGQKPWNTGRKMSPDYVLKLKKADRSASYKSVVQLDANGVEIKEWPSMKHAQAYFGVKGLYKVLSTKYPYNKTYAGFKWRLV